MPFPEEVNLNNCNDNYTKLFECVIFLNEIYITKTMKYVLISLIMSKSFFQTVTRNSLPLFCNVKLQILPSSGSN